MQTKTKIKRRYSTEQNIIEKNAKTSKDQTRKTKKYNTMQCKTKLKDKQKNKKKKQANESKTNHTKTKRKVKLSNTK